MKSFLKYTLATIVGLIITTFIIFFIFMGIIASMMPKEEIVHVKKKSILHIKLDYPIKERTSKNPFESFDFQKFEKINNLGLNDILKNIKKAKSDENIKGILLDISQLETNMANIEEIRNALIEFKKSGKFIYSYSDYYSQGSYYLVSVSDKIYMNPQGIIEFKGIGSEQYFFKGALEKLGLEPQIIRHGKFKAAVEPFMLDKMSTENRLQTETLINSIWDDIVEGISNERKISVEDLTSFANNLIIRNGKSAVENKLIDDLKYRDELVAELKGVVEIGLNKNLRLISLKKYTKTPQKREYKGLAKDKIAIIYASGEIIMGDGGEDKIGSADLSETIRKARKDSAIKAIVLRINSPGGSALASEIIWREVTLAKLVKPVIVSMGGVAASGGYYIACPADKIVADPNTITGSIGVFGLLFNSEKLLNDKLGITVDRVTTNDYSDIGSPTRKLKDKERAVIQQTIEEIYDVFVKHVSEGRNLTWEEVDNIGQGRVWSGINAKEIGLIDEFGGLQDAVEFAKEAANLEIFRIVELPEQKEPFEQLISEITGETTNMLLKNKFGKAYNYYNQMESIIKMEGVQARLPYSFEIK